MKDPGNTDARSVRANAENTMGIRMTAFQQGIKILGGEKHGDREAPSGRGLGALVHCFTMITNSSDDKVIRTDLLRKRGSDRLEAAQRAENLVPLCNVLLGHRP